MDEIKIQALKDLGISQDVIDALLADVEKTEKSALMDNVRYKTDPVEQAAAQFIAALRAKMSDDQVLTWLKEQTQALTAPTGAAASTVADSGKQSAVVKAYDVRRDPIAIAAGADQLR